MAEAYDSSEFARAAAALGPFETAPHVAVACSGGADSLALALLAHRWASGLGGRVTALIVDHAMRTESAAEAAGVRRQLEKSGLEAVVLTRKGASPTADRQAMARKARYALMTEWCRAAGVLHLMLGQHRGDQAETLMLRLGRGSGVDGLAAMAAVTENAHLRLLRPLLGVPRERLVAFLQSLDMIWVDDPSNRDEAFARVRMRRLLPALDAEGLTETRLADTAVRMARARAAIEQAATDVLAKAVAIYPEGYAVFLPDILLAAPEEVGLRALSRLLVCVGGQRHAPRLERLERLYEWLKRPEGRGRTLGGCRVAMRPDGHVIVGRETAAIGEPIPAQPNALWDGRFRLSREFPGGLRVEALGAGGWAEIRGEVPKNIVRGLPSTVRNAIPAIKRLEEVAKVPHLRYRELHGDESINVASDVTFMPPKPLSAARFSAVSDYA